MVLKWQIKADLALVGFPDGLWVWVNPTRCIPMFNHNDHLLQSHTFFISIDDGDRYQYTPKPVGSFYCITSLIKK
jgi:hypothetical protein